MISPAEAVSLIVTPGDVVGSIDHYAAGKGTHTQDKQIVASYVGIKHIQHMQEQQTQTDNPKQINAAQTKQKSVVSVSTLRPLPIVPQIGDIVVARVVRLTVRSVSCVLLCVGTSLLSDTFTGIIRQRDIRAFDIDSVLVQRCFRPGDLIRARIVSLGDSRSYYLSTAENELGVIEAISPSQVRMIPISWQQMQCPISKIKEYRKVAKQ